MTTFNTEIDEMIELSKQLDEDLDKLGWKQVIRGKERACCKFCGFCPDSMVAFLKNLLVHIEAKDGKAVKPKLTK